MPIACDPTADKNGAELVRLSRLYEFPEFVKTADFAETLQPAQRLTGSCADPMRGAFSCHSRAATWLSALYLHEKKAEFHPKEWGRIRERLERFVDYHQVRPDYDAMVARCESLHKSADDQLPDSAFAYVWVDSVTGRKDRDLPLRNALEVKRAAEWLHEYRDRIPFGDRHTIAGKVLDKAAQFGAGLGDHDEFLEKQAGLGICDPAEVVALLENRARLAGKDGHRAMLTKLAETVRTSKRAALQPAMLVKLAETIDVTDRAIGLVGHYSELVPRPEDVIFKFTRTKTAGELGQLCQLQSGTCYDHDTLSKVALDDVQALFGDEFARQVKGGNQAVDGEKLAAVVGTLPLPDARLFDRLMADQQLRPQATKTAACGPEWGPEILAALAQELPEF